VVGVWVRLGCGRVGGIGLWVGMGVMVRVV